MPASFWLRACALPFAGAILLSALPWIGGTAELRGQAMEAATHEAPRMLGHASLRFGGGGHNAADFTPAPSILENGMLAQPFYWNSGMGRWYRLTATAEGLSFTMSSGTGGSHWTGSHFPVGGAFDTGARGLLVLEDLEVSADGPSALRAAGQLTLQSQPLRVEHHYALDPEAPILRVTTRVRNLGDAPVANVHLWIGAGDDWIGNSDTPQKDRGNLVGGAFERIAHGEDPAAALLLSTLAEAVLLFSPAPGAGVIHDRCCSFSNSYLARPATAFPEGVGDGSYALHLPVGDLAPGGAAEVVWFYAAAPRSELAGIVGRVMGAATASR